MNEIEGVPGLYKFIPYKILTEFRCNSNFMYCIDFKSGKIICERKFSDYGNNSKNKRTNKIKRGKKQVQRNSKKTINSAKKN